MNIDTISQFLAYNRRKIILVWIFLIAFFAFGGISFAADAASSATGGDDVGSMIVNGLNVILKIVGTLLGVLTALVSLFLYPGWTNGTLFGLQDYLKEMWILVSNVVYFIFAFILIVIAFMNIIGKGDQWELKSALPKFIVGILIVPFSWFFVQFVLSVSAVLTVGVLTLPYDIFQDKDFLSKVDSEIPVCIELEVYLGSPEGGSASDSELDEQLGEYMNCKEESTIGKIMSGDAGKGGEGVKNSIFGIISIYTYGILKIDGLDSITSGDITITGGIKALLDLGLKVIFDIIFVLVYFVLMAALFLALFVRGIWLWMYMMMSPAFGLLYFFGKGGEGVGDGDAKFSIKEFVSLALVPVYVSAALSFGLVFLFVASQGIQEKAGDGKDVLELGGFKMTIYGAHGDSTSQKSALARLIVQIFGIAMLWIAVMAALKQSSTTGKIIEPIAQFGKSVGSLVASSPMYAPIIPGGAGGMQSAASLQTIGGQVQSSVAGMQTDRAKKFMDNTPLGNNEMAKLNTEASKIANNIEASGVTEKKAIEELGKLLSQGATTDKVITSKESQRAINATLDKLEIDKSKFNLDDKRGVTDALLEIDKQGRDRYGIDLIKDVHLRTGGMSPKDLDEIIEKNSSGAVPSQAPTVNITGGDISAYISAGKVTKETELIQAVKTKISGSNISKNDLDSQLKSAGVVDDTDRGSIITKVMKDLDTNEDGTIDGGESE